MKSSTLIRKIMSIKPPGTNHSLIGRPRKYDHDVIMAIKYVHKGGISLKQISEETGMSYSTVVYLVRGIIRK